MPALPEPETRDQLRGVMRQAIGGSPVVTALICLLLLLRILPDWLPALPLGFAAVWLALLAGVVAVLVLERGQLSDLYVTRSRLRTALLAGALTWPPWLMFAVLYTLQRLGEIRWMPLEEYPSTLAAAAFFAVVEELLFRGFLLSRLASWLGPRPANAIQATLFLVAHPRYLGIAAGSAGLDPWLMVGMLLGLVAGVVALRYRNVWGAVTVHFGFDFLIFLPLAGALTTL